MGPHWRKRAPFFDIHLRTGAAIEVFYADRALETFGRCGAGWFWWVRQRGCSPAGPATGPFATGYSAYRHAMNSASAPPLSLEHRRTLGEQNVAIHVPNVGHGRADTPCYGVIKPHIR